jgi:hypothetical protein
MADDVDITLPERPETLSLSMIASSLSEMAKLNRFSFLGYLPE